MESKKILKKLIKIPSYVGEGCNEKNLGEFIYKYLSTLPWLTVNKKFVEKDRFNVVAKDTGSTEVLICDHMDTVQPQLGWKTNPFEAVEKEGKLFGLGSSDTKGNIATILTAIKKVGQTKGVFYLFYTDEEYDFKGIKKFIKEFKTKIKPKIIASGDGGNLEIGNACRGLIEITLKVKGKSGHSAIPESGKNAIWGSFQAIQALKLELEKIKTKDLGKNTLNLAWIKGGQKLERQKELGKEGNIIPNFAEFVLEVRTSSSKVDAGLTLKLIRECLKKQGLNLVSYKIRHDLGSWITPESDLSFLPIKTKIFTKACKRGYVDLQMLWKTFGKPTCFTFGVGEANTAHKANEHVCIDKLIKGEKFWIDFINKFAQKG